jgi:hypothetical protein
LNSAAAENGVRRRSTAHTEYLRIQARATLAQLHRHDPHLLATMLAATVEKNDKQMTVDFAHAFLTFCQTAPDRIGWRKFVYRT